MCQMYFVLKMSEPTPTHQHQSSSLAKEVIFFTFFIDLQEQL